eukprot:1419711-Amphidinium_carterae.2
MAPNSHAKKSGPPTMDGKTPLSLSLLTWVMGIAVARRQGWIVALTRERTAASEAKTSPCHRVCRFVA